MQTICSDLKAQYCELDDLVSGLEKALWRHQTPFCGWTIFDQIAHIAFFDGQALLALEDPGRFRKQAPNIMQILMAVGEWPPKTNPLLGVGDSGGLLHMWRQTRRDLVKRLAHTSTRERINWFGPPMGARSFASARLMEAWAHGQDIFDALGRRRINNSRLRHVAHLGVASFGWSFKIRRLPVPALKPRVELSGPARETWTWGAAAAGEVVRGPAQDFCLVVTQRRNVADTDLTYRGAFVTQWLAAPQAFAGIRQDPPAPGERVVRKRASN